MHRNFGLRHAGRITADDDSPSREDRSGGEAERKGAAPSSSGSCVTARTLSAARETREG